MNLDAALDAALDQRPRKGPTCTMGSSLQAMPADTAAKVITILTTPRADGQMVSTSIISNILIDHGYPVKPDAVMRHRRTLLGRNNGCACDVDE